LNLENGKNAIINIIKSLTGFEKKLDSQFDRSVDMIKDADKVIVSGIGKSGIIGQKMAATLTSVGKPAVFLHPVEALHGDIGIVGKNDVAVFISKSGNTKEVISLHPFIRSRGAKIISIVGSDNGWMNRHSDTVLNASIDKEVCPVDLAPTTSTTAALIMADALSVAYMKAVGVSETDFARNHPDGQIGRNVTLQVRDVMHKGEDVPRIMKTKTLREAVIEITRKDLGCVCVIDQQHRLIGILTDGDVRRILQNDEDIRQLKVSDVMTKKPQSVSKSAFLGEALTLMENRPRQISVLPVVEDKQLVGVLRIHDILQQKS
jgi:arabinose-5-phosphate isomerase